MCERVYVRHYILIASADSIGSRETIPQDRRIKPLTMMSRPVFSCVLLILLSRYGDAWRSRHFNSIESKLQRIENILVKQAEQGLPCEKLVNLTVVHVTKPDVTRLPLPQEDDNAEQAKVQNEIELGNVRKSMTYSSEEDDSDESDSDFSDDSDEIQGRRQAFHIKKYKNRRRKSIRNKQSNNNVNINTNTNKFRSGGERVASKKPRSHKTRGN